MKAFETSLPIDDVLDEIRSGLARSSRLVLAAPPGAGKTTRVPLALLDEGWVGAGRIILLEPRRIAARAAASRMAQTLGEPVGQTIGLRTRMDVRVSQKTRIEVVTEGVFTRMILDDPELEGVSAILFDEFHERSLDADLGLALALEVQDAFREDLRLMPMSATLDTQRLSSFLDAETVESDGRAFPVDTRYLGRDPRARVEDMAAKAVRRALSEERGSVLVFLPGMAEITRTADRLADLPDTVDLTPLYGALTGSEQDAAIRPSPKGRRKVVLATDIAESSLTIEGVRIVIDAGLARVPRFDAQLGASRLDTVRAARANVDQRRGRAGRTEPGVCFRLWGEAQTRGLPDFPVPEILSSDLSGLALDLASWGTTDPNSLKWLDPPPSGVWAGACSMLESLGAMDADHRLTAFGKRVAGFGLAPRQAAMVLHGAEAGAGQVAAGIAALLSERGLGGRSVDARERLARFGDDRSPRAKAMRNLADRWAKKAGGNSKGLREDAGVVIARGFPDRIARARPGKPGEYLMANGRACQLDPADPLAASTWLAIADVTGGGPVLRIQLAAPLDETEALGIGGVETCETASFDPRLKRLAARRVRRLGAITLEETPLPKPSGDTALAALLEAVSAHGLEVLPCSEALETVARRVAILHETLGDPWPDDFDTMLAERIIDWLAPLLIGKTGFDQLDSGACIAAAKTLLDWPLSQEIDQLAPAHWTTPAGRKAKIVYDADMGPTVQARVQELYGLIEHPAIAGGRIPLALELLSPAQRPVAVTRDIAGFWSGGYGDMRKDMRGRYPKHDWPEDPANAAPQTGARRKS